MVVYKDMLNRLCGDDIFSFIIFTRSLARWTVLHARSQDGFTHLWLQLWSTKLYVIHNTQPLQADKPAFTAAEYCNWNWISPIRELDWLAISLRGEKTYIPAKVSQLVL